MNGDLTIGFIVTARNLQQPFTSDWGIRPVAARWLFAIVSLAEAFIFTPNSLTTVQEIVMKCSYLYSWRQIFSLLCTSTEAVPATHGGEVSELLNFIC